QAASPRSRNGSSKEIPMKKSADMKPEQKDPLISASNALAFQARQLRKVAIANEPKVDTLLKTPHELGAEDNTEKEQQREAQAARAAEVTAPLIARAQARLDDVASLIDEHGEFI